MLFNNPAIKEIRIKYNYGPLVVKKIGENQSTYLDYTVDDEKYVKEITGLNEKKEVIYSYKW